MYSFDLLNRMWCSSLIVGDGDAVFLFQRDVVVETEVIEFDADPGQQAYVPAFQ